MDLSAGCIGRPPAPSQGTCSKNWNTLPAPPKSSRLHSPTKSAAIDINSQFEPGFPLGLSRKKGLQSTRNAVPEVVPELEVNSEIRTPERASKDSSQHNSPERNDGHPDDIKYTFIPAAEAVSLTASYDAIKMKVTAALGKQQQRWRYINASAGATSAPTTEAPTNKTHIPLGSKVSTGRSANEASHLDRSLSDHTELTSMPMAVVVVGRAVCYPGQQYDGGSYSSSRSSSSSMGLQPSRPTTELWHLAPTDPPRLDQPFAPRLGPRGAASARLRLLPRRLLMIY